MRLLNQNGITLMEMVVTAAIIGVLAAVGVPFYENAVMYARQKEAKIGLSAVFASEVAMFSEWTSYTMCLRQIAAGTDWAGVRAGASVRNYRIGFINGVNNNNCGPASNQSCLLWDFTVNRAVALAGNPCNNPADTILMDTAGLPINQGAVGAHNVSRFTFQAGAIGILSRSIGRMDYWTIDQQKTLRNVQSGF